MNISQFLESLPGRVPPEALAGLDATINFDLTGDDGGQYTLSIHDNTIRHHPGLAESPTCGVKSDHATFVRIINKEENVLMAMFTGKLKIHNQMEMVRFAKILGLM